MENNKDKNDTNNTDDLNQTNSVDNKSNGNNRIIIQESINLLKMMVSESAKYIVNKIISPFSNTPKSQQELQYNSNQKSQNNLNQEPQKNQNPIQNDANQGTQNNLAYIALLSKKDPLLSYEKLIDEFEKTDDALNQQKIAVIMSGIFQNKINDQIMKKWDNNQYQIRSFAVREKLNQLIQKIDTENEVTLSSIAISIAKFSLIEYPKGLWEPGFNNIFVLENTQLQFSDQFVFINMQILLFLLENKIPDSNFPDYDEKVINIVDVLNICLDKDYILPKFSELIHKTILICIQFALSRFEKFYQDNQIFSAQINHLLKLFNPNIPEEQVIPNQQIAIIYDIFNLAVEKYYDNISFHIQNLFSLSISHLEDPVKRIYSLNFWANVAKTEKRIGLKRSKKYTLGVIKFIVEKYLFPFITMTDVVKIADDTNESLQSSESEDDLNESLQILEVAENCLREITKTEPEAMFGLLAQYYLDHQKDLFLNNRLSALISFRCITSVFDVDEIKFIDEQFNSIIEFAKDEKQKLRRIALNILKKILENSPSIIIKNEERVKSLIDIALSNQQSDDDILTECFHIFILILKQFPQTESNYIFNNFDKYYSFVFQAFKSNSHDLFNAANDYFIELIERAPEDCNPQILQILEDYLNADVASKNFSLIEQLYISSLPFIVNKIHLIITDEIVKKLMEKLMKLIDTDMDQDVLDSLVEIIPFASQNKYYANDENFWKSLYCQVTKLLRPLNFSTIDFITKSKSLLVLTSFFESRPEQLNLIYEDEKTYLHDILTILLHSLSDQIVRIQPFPSIFHLLALIAQKADTGKFIVYIEELLPKIKIFTSDLNVTKDNVDDDLKELYYEILSTYFGLLNVFMKIKSTTQTIEKENLMLLKKIEKSVLMFLKTIELLNVCYDDLLVESVKIIFVIICTLGSNSFFGLAQPLIKQILERGSQYTDDKSVSQTSTKILNILNDFN